MLKPDEAEIGVQPQIARCDMLPQWPIWIPAAGSLAVDRVGDAPQTGDDLGPQPQLVRERQPLRVTEA